MWWTLPSGSLAPDLGGRVPVGHPCAPTWILAVRLGAGPDGGIEHRYDLDGILFIVLFGGGNPSSSLHRTR
jgi:hypothetical protein